MPLILPKALQHRPVLRHGFSCAQAGSAHLQLNPGFDEQEYPISPLASPHPQSSLQAKLVGITKAPAQTKTTANRCRIRPSLSLKETLIIAARKYDEQNDHKLISLVSIVTIT